MDSFVFYGFIPHKKGRQTLMKSLNEEYRTTIFYESPHRLMKTLEQFKEFLGEERQLSVSREITKLYEETVNGTVADLIEYYSQNPIKGEFVIVLAGQK